MSLIELESERLVLRQWQVGDFEAYARYYSAEETARFVGGVCARDIAWRRLAATLGHWQMRGHGEWALEEKSSGTLVGAAGLNSPEGWPELELGYWLLPEYQGKGYATEAAGRAKEYAFGELKRETLVSYIDPRNSASIAVAERLGATYEATIALCQFGDHCVYRYV